MGMVTRKDRCRRAPRGWRCDLWLDHEGPCPAYPVGLTYLRDLWQRRRFHWAR